MEPNLDDLFRPKHFTRQQVIVMILLCIFAAWLLWPSSQPRRPSRPAPPPAAKPKPAAAPPLFVTIMPEEAGWCCDAGKVSAANRTACKGTFFAKEEEAKRLCPTAPSGSPRGRGTGA